VLLESKIYLGDIPPPISRPHIPTCNEFLAITMALAPVPQAMGVFPQFIAQQSETIVLKEKVLSLSGDSFHIKLANGTPLFQVEGKVLSISGRKIVRDMAGNELFHICKEHLHIHTTFAIKDPQDRKIMEVKSKFACESPVKLPWARVQTQKEDELRCG
jgi:hypothetical protein